MTGFFVTESGKVAQPSDVAGWGTDVPPQPRMGRVERTCDRCGREWGPTRCTDPQCNSIMFTDTVVPAVPVMTRVMDRIKPKKTLHATASQIKALRNLQASATALLVDLRVLDVQLRDAVRADVDELREAQGLMNLSLSITGDASPDRIAHLSLSLTAFAASLSRAIANLEAVPK